MIMNTNKISFDKAVVNLLNGDTSTVFTMDDDALTLNLAFSKKDENGEYKILGNKEVSIYSVGGTPIFDFDDGVNEFFNYDTDNAYLEDLDCEEVY